MKPIVVPDGEFTFQEICRANPTILPLDVLKFVSKQVSEGKLHRNKAALKKGSAITYTPASRELAV